SMSGRSCEAQRRSRQPHILEEVSLAELIGMENGRAIILASATKIVQEVRESGVAYACCIGIIKLSQIVGSAALCRQLPQELPAGSMAPGSVRASEIGFMDTRGRPRTSRDRKVPPRCGLA